MKRHALVSPADLLPHGMMCPYCSREFQAGDEIVEYLEGMVDDVPLVLSGVCSSCAQEIETSGLTKCVACDGTGEQGHGYGVGITQCSRCNGVGEVIRGQV